MTPLQLRRHAPLIAGVVLMLVTVAVYWRSLAAPFVFDDIPAIERNATIRQLWPPWRALCPPTDGSGVSGRPLVNLSLAINYAVGGLDPRGYHGTNLVLHALAALVLWGVLRRTLRLGGSAAADADLFAWTAALLWTIHPLLTESVVCVVQRNEILGSGFILLTLYGFIRSAAPDPVRGESHSSRSAPGWLMVSWLACLAGVASKETVVTAPVLVFLYDRTFVAGTFRAAWMARRKYYGALVATWVLLGWLVWLNRQRGGTVGFGLTISSWEYLLTQCRALVLYLKLALWPDPLVLDYGWPVVRRLGEVWWQAAIVLTLLAATVVALVRKPVVGFLGAVFFILLAPSSSFVPLTTQTIAEHRMYLPLAAVLVLLLSGGHALAGRRALLAGLVASLAFGAATLARNRAYRSELSIWMDTVAKCPDNPRAHGNLGRAYLMLGRWEEALAACQRELEIDPSYNGDARANIGRALTELGRPAEAIPFFEAGLRLGRGSFDVHNNYGMALAALGRWSDAVVHYEAALRLNAESGEPHNNLANALVQSGRLSEAVVHYAAAVALSPELVEAEANWGRALAENGRFAEALPHFERALRLRPDAAACFDLANSLAALGRLEEALPHYEAGLRREAENAPGHYGLGNTLARLGRYAEAVGPFAAAVRVAPAWAEARQSLGAALMAEGRTAEAAVQFEATVRLRPASADAHHQLALVLGELGRTSEAMRHEREALRLRPDFAEAREHLEWLHDQ